MSQVAWLSHLLKMIAITGGLEVRCAYGATEPAKLLAVFVLNTNDNPLTTAVK